jgi:2-haloacid dehalogenase
MTGTRLEGIEACVFDAYGTLFDVTAAASHCQAELGPKWQPLAEMWRAKQLQYTWLRSLSGHYVDFWQVTTDALDFSLASLTVDDAALRRQLLDLYFALDCYPEVPEVLARVKAAGLKTAVLSNGSPAMLASAVGNAGVEASLDAVISVDEIGIYKPKPEVYALVAKHLGVDGRAVSFQSSNAWDAHGASAYGFRVVWVNRFGQARERLPGAPDVELASLTPLPDVLGLDG